MMLLEQLRQSRDQINAACHRYGARRIRVFGSVARGEERPDSDIDFLVDLPHGYDLMTQRIPLQQRLTEITGRRLDVVTEHELNRHIRDAVLREALDL
jgi:predicted nucleotidyltransferase